MSFFRTTIAAATFAVAAAGAASAVTVFDITPNDIAAGHPTESNRANGTLYDDGNTTIGSGDRFSVEVKSDGTGATSGAIGFEIDVPTNGRFRLTFTPDDFTDFGVTQVGLSTSTNPGDVFVGSTITPIPGGPAQGFGATTISATVTDSPLYILFDWSTASGGSFSGDLTISAVPVPAAGLLLLTALGGMGVMRRRKTA